MKMMKTPVFNVLIAAALLAVSISAAAQEVAIRKGVVTGIAPVQVQTQAAEPQRPSATGNALTRSLARLAGRTAANATGGYSSEAYDVASSATRDATDTARVAAPGTQTSAAYMVMIRFDDSSESAIQTADASRLSVGDQVRVLGSGDSAQIIPGN
ncbi:hypothetical protein [Lysobacter sp. F6437]|uniref:hypothetical protein n=1 Tax=Lysobacter sp. F6437 TaxID=3459296 RepID=UPI00403E2C09